MKRISTFLVVIIVLVGAQMSCKKKPKSLSELLGRAWSAQIIKEGATTVYIKGGGATNVKPGYANFKLDLSNPQTATLKEVDGNIFTGQWEVRESATGNTLVLKNLTPQPTGTNGTIEFTINSATEAELNITRTTSSQKTRGTINNYALVSP